MSFIKKHIIVLIGPNLNKVHEKGIYGDETSESIKLQIISKAEEMGISCEVFQSNWEGALIDKIYESKEKADGAVISPGALAHYSYAIRDAISIVKIPFIEIHPENIYSKEDFRCHSVLSDVCAGQIVGFGKSSYFLGISALHELI